MTITKQSITTDCVLINENVVVFVDSKCMNKIFAKYSLQHYTGGVEHLRLRTIEIRANSENIVKFISSCILPTALIDSVQ